MELAISRKSENVGSGDLIVVNGTTGYYEFDFTWGIGDSAESRDQSHANGISIRVTYTSGDPRPVSLKYIPADGHPEVRNEVLGRNTGDFHSKFTCEEFHFTATVGTNRIRIENKPGTGFFPHVKSVVLHAENVVSSEHPADVKYERPAKTAKHSRDATWLQDQVRQSVERRSNAGAKLKYITPPSRDIHDTPELTFCENDKVQDANPGFQPDSKYYDAVNCEGLWVCATRNCRPGTAELCATLVRAYVPIEIRQLFLKWQAPAGRPLGPMRLVINDEASGDKAGNAPDFPDDWAIVKSRTSNPASFTCTDDVWRHATTVIHELTHAIDMVLRQQLDPAFHFDLDKLYEDAFAKNTYGKCYAATNRHEYFAELMTMWMNVGDQAHFRFGCHQCGTSKTGTCNLSKHQDTQRNPPGSCKPDIDKSVNKHDLLREDPNAFKWIKGYFKEMPDHKTPAMKLIKDMKFGKDWFRRGL